MDRELTGQIDKVLRITVVLVVLNCIVSSLGFYNYRTSLPLLASALVLTVMTIRLYRSEGFSSKIPWCFFIPSIILGVSYAVNGLLYFTPTYLVLGYIFALQIPLMYVCLKQINIKRIIRVICETYSITAVFITIVCMLVAPITEGQYYGIFNNPNLFGHYITTVAGCVLYMFVCEERTKYKALWAVLLGALVGFTIFTRSRTTMIAFIFIGLVYIIYLAKTRNVKTGSVKTRNNVLKQLVILAIAIAIAIPSLFFVLNTITPAVCDITGYRYEMSEDEQGDHTGKLFDHIKASATRSMKGITTEGSFSSGRIAIWKTYWMALGIKGHSPELLQIIGYNEPFFANAHNSFLHIAYQSGILSGIAFIFIYVWMCCLALKSFVKKSITVDFFFAMIGLANALPYIMLSNVMAPYISFSLLPIWLAIIPYSSCKDMKEPIHGIKNIFKLIGTKSER